MRRGSGAVGLRYGKRRLFVLGVVSEPHRDERSAGEGGSRAQEKRAAPMMGCCREPMAAHVAQRPALRRRLTEPMTAAIRSRLAPRIRKPLWLVVAVEPPPVPTPPDGTCGICGTGGVPVSVGGALPVSVCGGRFACGGAARGGAACVRFVSGTGELEPVLDVEPVLGVGPVLGVEPVLGVALVEGVALGTGTTAAVMTLVTLAEQVKSVPPALPVLLHWLIVIGIEAVTVDGVATEQTAVEPPPVAEPLHWVTVAPDVLAGNGLHTRGPRPPKLPPPLADPTH